MTTTEQRLADIAVLSPEDKVMFMLNIAEKMFEEVLPTVHVTERQQRYLDAVNRAMNAAFRWANGETMDGESVLYPAYNNKGTDTWDTEVPEDLPEFSLDVIMAGSLGSKAALLAASTQFEREGLTVEDLPHPFEDYYDNELLIEHIEHERARFEPRFQRKYDEFWEARFRPV